MPDDGQTPGQPGRLRRVKRQSAPRKSADKSSDKKLRTPDKMTPQCVERILNILGVGGTWNMAAAAGGISPDTLKNWRDADEAFRASCARARDDGAQKLADRIRLEAESGDWRAASWLLERIAPDVYGRRVLIGGVAGGAPIQIEGELKTAGSIRSNRAATKQLHHVIATAAGTAAAATNGKHQNGKAGSNGKHEAT